MKTMSIAVSPPMKFMQMVRCARPVFELNVKPKDEVLLITDSDMDPNVWQAIAAAGVEYGVELMVMMMADPRETHAERPPEPILEAQKHAKLTIANTSKEYHTGGFFRISTDAGHGFVVMEQIYSDILTGPACRPDVYKSMAEVAPSLKEKMDKSGGTWHITSESGTEFTCQVKPNTGRATCGGCRTFGATGLAAIPAGEFAARPVAGTGEGTVVWDVSCHHPVGFLKEPIKLTVKKGWVTDITGGIEAKQLKDYIKKYGNENTFKFDVELSIGWNPKAEFTGALRMDKKRYGKIHTAMGFSGESLHLDGVTRDITLVINGEHFMDKGVIKLPPLDKWAH